MRLIQRRRRRGRPNVGLGTRFIKNQSLGSARFPVHPRGAALWDAARITVCQFEMHLSDPLVCGSQGGFELLLLSFD